jgi:hypothetical protein
VFNNRVQEADDLAGRHEYVFGIHNADRSKYRNKSNFACLCVSRPPACKTSPDDLLPVVLTPRHVSRARRRSGISVKVTAMTAGEA